MSSFGFLINCTEILKAKILQVELLEKSVMRNNECDVSDKFLISKKVPLPVSITLHSN